MWTILIPVAFIGVFLIVFFLFKDKFIKLMGGNKNAQAYNEADRMCKEEREAVVGAMFVEPDRFKLVKDAIGEAEIECICPCEPKKGIARKLLKGAAEALTMHQTFDMSLYYLVVAGGELHLLQSDGDKIVAHDAFKLNNLSNVEIRPEGAVTKVTNFIFSNNNATAGSRESIFFRSNDVDYSYRLLDLFVGYPKFTVEKGYSNGKFGQNPFYRVFAADLTTQSLLTAHYGPESMAKFREKMGRFGR
ncbi:MAG: hypothetical protein LBH06_07805 [Rikenellaceae bacterium]|jgi:hypothetical protein|nr:hypothetical protein [Rikenellaceae bacterium]